MGTGICSRYGIDGLFINLLASQSIDLGKNKFLRCLKTQQIYTHLSRNAHCRTTSFAVISGLDGIGPVCSVVRPYSVGMVAYYRCILEWLSGMQDCLAHGCV